MLINLATRSTQVLCLLALSLTIGLSAPTKVGAVNWDGQSGTSWWFDPVNWGNHGVGAQAPFYLVPSNPGGETVGTTEVNNGWDAEGEGVVYDPDNDPFYEAAAGPDFIYPVGNDPAFDRDTIWRFYISTGSATLDNKVTIKSGSLEVATSTIPSEGGGNVQLGRGGSVPDIKGTIVQTGGSFLVRSDNLDIGNFHTSPGNGYYEYHGGILEAGLGSASSHGIRLAPGGSGGSGKSGYFAVHNDDAPGRIRTWNFNVAAHMDGTFGTTNSTSIVEFFANSEGTRPVQVMNNLTINHQDDSAGSGGKRSAVLKLSLDAAPTLLGGGVPIDMGLFAVDGIIGGQSGIFYNDSIDNGGLPYNEGDIISATLGSSTYNWTISYTGNINWTNADTSVIASITGAGTGNDVVLIGHSSNVVGTPGDFNGDGNVDGRDFLVWQRNTSVGNLSDWQTNYGTGSLGAITAVPEPSTIIACFGCLALLVASRRSLR